MSVTIDTFHVPQNFTEEAATELVELLNSTEDACDWTYKVEGSKVAAYDEAGEFVQFL